VALSEPRGIIDLEGVASVRALAARDPPLFRPNCLGLAGHQRSFFFQATPRPAAPRRARRDAHRGRLVRGGGALTGGARAGRGSATRQPRRRRGCGASRSASTRRAAAPADTPSSVQRTMLRSKNDVGRGLVATRVG